MANKALKLAIVIIIGLLLTTGCATIGTVKSLLDEPSFQQENLPVRELKLAVATDGSRSRKNIEELIKKTSDLMEKQVGVRLIISHWFDIYWRSKDWDEMTDIFAARVQNCKNEFDVAVGFTNWNMVRSQAFVKKNRYIIIRNFTVHAFAHELGHAFLVGHSRSGLMAPNTGPFSGATDFFTAEDRERVLINKWRNFTKD